MTRNNKNIYYTKNSRYAVVSRIKLYHKLLSWWQMWLIHSHQQMDQLSCSCLTQCLPPVECWKKWCCLSWAVSRVDWPQLHWLWKLLHLAWWTLGCWLLCRLEVWAYRTECDNRSRTLPCWQLLSCGKSRIITMRIYFLKKLCSPVIVPHTITRLDWSGLVHVYPWLWILQLPLVSHWLDWSATLLHWPAAIKRKAKKYVGGKQPHAVQWKCLN